MTKVHFICRGNVLRSLVAETYLRSLEIPDIDVISSGTDVDRNDPLEALYFSETIELLAAHGVESHAKTHPDQLTQQRLATHSDIVILMNQRVVDEANQQVILPSHASSWNIVDIGEGDRTKHDQGAAYREEIYQEIVVRVDSLVAKL